MVISFVKVSTKHKIKVSYYFMDQFQSILSIQYGGFTCSWSFAF